MADKPRSFRIDDETAEKFKEISGIIGGNQQQTLAKLIETFEFQAGKKNFPDTQEALEDFERYTSSLNRLFLTAIEKNQDLRNTIHAEYEALLMAKDENIVELREKLSTLAEQSKEDRKQTSYFKDENERLSQHITDIEYEYQTKIDNMKLMLDDKENLNRALTVQYSEMKQSLDNMAGVKEQVTQLEKENKSLHGKIASLEGKHNTLVLEHQKVVLDLQLKYNNEITALKQEHLNEIDQYQQHYKVLLEEKVIKVTEQEAERQGMKKTEVMVDADGRRA